MRRHLFCLLTLFGLLISALAVGEEANNTGIVKGTITIGGKPTPDAVVSVEGVSPGNLKSRLLSLASKPATMEQRDMKFIPRVLAVVAGTRVDFPNDDKTWHNVYSASQAKKFDLGLYPPGKSGSVTFDEPGVVRILCNVHPSMEAYIVVKDHPYFSVPDSRGNYSINGIPPGRYRVQVWHPELGTRVIPVELAREGEVLSIDIDLKKK